jgi:hypothetical protein
MSGCTVVVKDWVLGGVNDGYELFRSSEYTEDAPIARGPVISSCNIAVD